MKKNNPFDETPFETKELARFTSEFNNESDRGAVLIAGSRIDEVLKNILEAYLRDTKSAKDLLGGFNAPLGTFSSRARACHALGLIEDHEFDEITLIRKMRNEFGHKWKDIGFESDKISSLAMQLPWLGPPEKFETSSIRSRFNVAVVILLADLMWRERYVLKEKRVARKWPNKMRKQLVKSIDPTRYNARRLGQSLIPEAGHA